jgi:hypothetical protein
MLNIERFEIGQSYVTAKVQNRYGEKVTINIQGGRPGIELQESFFKMKEEKGETPSFAYLIIRLVQDDSKIFARKLPVVGQRDWLLIYEDTLLELSVKVVSRMSYDQQSGQICRLPSMCQNDF